MSDPSPDRFHSDPSHWRLGIFYVCREDSRIIVPKRIQGLGWTINFGRPMAVPLLVFIVALIPATVAVARYFGAGDEVRLAIKLALVAGILLLCYFLSRQSAKPPDSPPDSEKPNA